MRLPHEAPRSSVYLNFKEICSSEHQTIVRFYEEYEADIQLLTVEEYFEMSLAYASALFEVGAYSSFLAACDDLIESVIFFNIDNYKGENIYHKLLFRKAAALYHVMEYPESEKILRQLMRMNSKDEIVIAFLKKCIRAQPTKRVRKAKAVSVVLFLVTASIIAAEIFVIKTLFPEYGKGTEYLRNTIFVAGWLILVGSGLYLRYRAYRIVSRERKI